MDPSGAPTTRKCASTASPAAGAPPPPPEAPAAAASAPLSCATSGCSPMPVAHTQVPQRRVDSTPVARSLTDTSPSRTSDTLRRSKKGRGRGGAGGSGRAVGVQWACQVAELPSCQVLQWACSGRGQGAQVRRCPGAPRRLCRAAPGAQQGGDALPLEQGFRVAPDGAVVRPQHVVLAVHQGHRRLAPRQLREEPGHVVADEVVQLGGHLHARGPATHHADRGQAGAVVGGRAGRGGQLEGLGDVHAQAVRVAHRLYGPGPLLDAGHPEVVGHRPRRHHQDVVGQGEGVVGVGVARAQARFAHLKTTQGRREVCVCVGGRCEQEGR
jgi:hypothetical protein